MISDYTRLTDFSVLGGTDSLPTVFNTEFNRVQTSSALKAPLLDPVFSGVVKVPPLAATASHAKDALKTSPAQSSEVYMHAFKTGTKMTFFQNTVPDGWQQDTSAAMNDALLHIVNTVGGGGVSGGSTKFVATPLNVTEGHPLIVSEMPAHTHSYTHVGGSGGQQFISGAGIISSAAATTGAKGGGGAHTHPIAWVPKYVSMIMCSKL